MKIEQFHIEIENGRVLFKSLHHKELFDKFVAQFPDGKYTLEINSKKSKRSDNQNRFYWLFMGMISRETGYTPMELHSLFKGMFSSEIKEVMGNKTRVGKSTADMTKGEFCEYIIEIHNFTGIETPDVVEYFGYDYRK